MKKSLKYREVLQDARRVVVKIGSRVLVQRNGRPDTRRMQALIEEMSAIHHTGIELAVVSSGAIAAGMESLKMRERPTALPDLQMAASVGQTRLMTQYQSMFGRRGCIVGQVLLTHADFHHKIRLTNARRTLENLLRNRVIPVINENDVVADEEIKAGLSLGDNDFLAALVVQLLRADLLILLSSVDGVREAGPHGRTKRIRYLEAISRNTFQHVTDQLNPISKGGMLSKLKAAQKAARSGCSVVIANGRKPEVLRNVIHGQDTGTMILASGL